MKKALIVASVFSFFPLFERSNIQLLMDAGYEIYVASNMSKRLGSHGDNNQFNNLNVNKIQVDFSRNPFSKNNLIAYKQIKSIYKNHEFEIVHCHTPIGGFITRLIFRKTQVSKLLYTAHGFHFYKGSPKINWILYFPVEYICSFFTDVLITINKEDYLCAKKYMKAKEIKLIHGVGLDYSKITNMNSLKLTREDLSISNDDIILLSVGEMNKNKNQVQIIRSLASLKEYKWKYLIAGEGPLLNELKALVASLEMADKIIFLGFRSDIMNLYNVSDVFCFPSHREGLSVALMEAMASGLPVVCSRIRGNVDLIQDGKGGFLCKNGNDMEYSDAIKNLIVSRNLRNQMGNFNKMIIKEYDQKIVKEEMRKIYNL